MGALGAPELINHSSSIRSTWLLQTLKLRRVYSPLLHHEDAYDHRHPPDFAEDLVGPGDITSQDTNHHPLS